jgi:hypothetical protein
MLYVGLTRVRTLDAVHARAADDRCRPARQAAGQLLREISRLEQLQPLELRPDPDVLARQITATKEKRAVGEAAQPSSKKPRVQVQKQKQK